MEQSTSTIRTWLEGTADRLMQNANATITLLVGVKELRYENDADPIYIDYGGPFMTTVPGPIRCTFVAVLGDGSTIETVRA